MNSLKTNNRKKLLRSIPSVDKIIERDDVKELLEEYSRGIVLKAIQKKLENVRKNILI